MKYCLDYKRESSYMNDCDEIIVKFQKKSSDLGKFINKHLGQRIIFDIEDTDYFLSENCIKEFQEIKDIYAGIALRFHKPSHELLEVLQLHTVDYFFNSYIINIDTLYEYIQYKPSDIYIAEALGFELKQIAPVLHDANISIRVFANVAQASTKAVPPMKNFFIRPEDVHSYESYVDTIEFFNQKSADTYYKIYAIDKQWNGPLSAIILGLRDCDVHNQFLLPLFGYFRIGCGKKCFKDDRTGCNMCDRVTSLSNTLHNKAIDFSKKI